MRTFRHATTPPKCWFGFLTCGTSHWKEGRRLGGGRVDRSLPPVRALCVPSLALCFFVSFRFVAFRPPLALDTPPTNTHPKQESTPSPVPLDHTRVPSSSSAPPRDTVHTSPDQKRKRDAVATEKAPFVPTKSLRWTARSLLRDHIGAFILARCVAVVGRLLARHGDECRS
jgi:hypothetical protein